MYLKGKCFKFVVSALVSTFYTFAEEMLVFYELELIITLDITIIGSFFMLIHLFVIVLLNLGGFARLLAMKYVF